MTVNERLFVAGLMKDFESAVNRKDKRAITEILKRVYLDDESIDAIFSSELENN